MINFIKNLLGLGSAEPAKSQETVKEILTPVVTASTPADNVTLQAAYIPPAKPVNKIKALGESGAEAVKAAVAPKSANKQRKPYRGNKTKAKPPVTQGNTKGGNGAVKQQPAQAKKPSAPRPAKKK